MPNLPRLHRYVAIICWTLLGWLALPVRPTQAFCGFYVAGADTKLYANATMVVLMRDGTRTVLSMQNNYEGPPEAFALVIPVPSVLKKDQVKTLSKHLFERVDMLSAPRLVEYWEHDPCAPDRGPVAYMRAGSGLGSLKLAIADEGSVRVLEQFAVAEYDIVILSAKDSNGLERWLRDKHYNIPEGAASALAPYVASGTKFFVAKVDPARVTFANGQAVLSPLRFHYDSPELALPVRLGLLNSRGTQDLIVHIVARGRYEVANYPNALLPTNLLVKDNVRDRFAAFYEAVFARTQQEHAGAVVTEYAWDASSCDPCPVPALTDDEVAALGGDVLQLKNGRTRVRLDSFGNNAQEEEAGLTLTRLHARYSSESLGEDLIFKRADAIMGGRDMPSEDGSLSDKVAHQAPINNFQGRYVILHRWEKPLSCSEPQRGRWGGPDDDRKPMARSTKNPALIGAGAAGKLDLSEALAQPVAALNTQEPAKPTPVPAAPTQPEPATPQAQTPGNGGCGCHVASGAGQSSPAAWLCSALVWAVWRRRNRLTRRGDA